MPRIMTTMDQNHINTHRNHIPKAQEQQRRRWLFCPLLQQQPSYNNRTSSIAAGLFHDNRTDLFHSRSLPQQTSSTADLFHSRPLPQQTSSTAAGPLPQQQDLFHSSRTSSTIAEDLFHNNRTLFHNGNQLINIELSISMFYSDMISGSNMILTMFL
ncbi:hypothetical protein ACRALDRAFT_204704 [Sodiomyces alcalophilus JCM 7366]|uniref:uncharacterized protein n=1 Tax=Sodiomyces alcalophilus JCM 7366 TaxID=591952 RepID=UPI0039B57F3E